METRTQNSPRSTSASRSAGTSKTEQQRPKPMRPARTDEILNQDLVGRTSIGNADGQQTEEVAERAYKLWETDGRPDGKDLEYWFRAEAELNRNTTP